MLLSKRGNLSYYGSMFGQKSGQTRQKKNEKKNDKKKKSGLRCSDLRHRQRFFRVFFKKKMRFLSIKKCDAGWAVC